MLREKFEPKLIINSDEETLFHCPENISASNESVLVNQFNLNVDTVDQKKINISPEEAKTNQLSPNRSDVIMSRSMKEKELYL